MQVEKFMSRQRKKVERGNGFLASYLSLIPVAIFEDE